MTDVMILYVFHANSSSYKRSNKTYVMQQTVCLVLTLVMTGNFASVFYKSPKANVPRGLDMSVTGTFGKESCL